MGFRFCGWKQAAPGLLFPVAIMAVVFLLDLGLGFLVVEPLSEVPHPADPAQTGITLPGLLGVVLLGALFTALVAALTEERAFRGYLIRRMEHLGPLKVLMLSGALFGLWHLPMSRFVLHAGWPDTIVYILNISLVGFLFGHVFLPSRRGTYRHADPAGGRHLGRFRLSVIEEVKGAGRCRLHKAGKCPFTRDTQDSRGKVVPSFMMLKYRS